MNCPWCGSSGWNGKGPCRQCGAREPKNPKRDRQLTDAFHRMLSRLKAPRRPVDGVKWNPLTHPIDWPGWPRVRMDVRMLK